MISMFPLLLNKSTDNCITVAPFVSQIILENCKNLPAQCFINDTRS